jgi:MarR family transcriptional regulator, 2-MHQ and catechol-resistance regulon repressor
MKIDELVNAKFKDDHHKAIVNIRYTSNWIGNFYNTQLVEFDITLPQFNILRILRGAKQKLSIKVVKERMLEKSPNTTRLIDKLIDKGLVIRTRCEIDRRVVYIEISEKGQIVLSRIDEVFDDISIRGSLTVQEAIVLSDLLDKIRG